MSDRVSNSVQGGANQARDNVGRLLNSQGQAMQQTTRQAADQAQGTLEQVRDYITEQPFSAALLALGIGYIVGRLHIL